MMLAQRHHTPWLLGPTTAEDLGPGDRQVDSVTTAGVGSIATGTRTIQRTETTPASTRPAVDLAAIEMWEAYQATEPTPHYQKPKPIAAGRVFNPTYSETTDTFTHLRRDTLYFGVDALANWRVQNPAQ